MAHGPGIHVRFNGGVLARLERRALEWIARRLPDSISPDHLSALGLASMAGTGCRVRRFPMERRPSRGGRRGDARRQLVRRQPRRHGRPGQAHRQRPRYGYYVDHVIDLAGTSLLFAGLACSGLMNPSLAVTLLAAYLLVAPRPISRHMRTAVFRMSFFGFGPTELRILLAAGAIKAAQRSVGRDRRAWEACGCSMSERSWRSPAWWSRSRCPRRGMRARCTAPSRCRTARR